MNPIRSGAGGKKKQGFCARARELERLRGPLHRSRSKELDPVKKLTHYSACFDNDWRFRRLAFCTPYPACNDVGMLFETDYIHADLPKPLPPIPVRVSRRSQLTAALRQHARPIVIEDQELARPFARLLRVGNCDCRRLVNSSRIRCRMR